jgi:sulfur carrier protein
LPPEVRINGQPVPLRAGDLADLLAELGYPADRAGIAVALNGRVVPRREWRGRRLQPGDELQIVGAVPGG